MLPLGHFGITAFMASLIFSSPLVGLLSAVLPDLFDKTLFLLHITPYTRFLGHTIFFGPVIAMSIYIISRKWGVSLVLLFGCWIHLAEDAKDFLPLFYPMANYQFPVGAIRIKYSMFNVCSEIIGLVMLILLIIYYDDILQKSRSINLLK